MRDPNLGTILYSAGDPTGISNLGDLIKFVRDQGIKTETAIRALAAGHLDRINVPPTKPRDGDVRYADGVDWNPGGGRGFYYYDGATWNQLG